jgi:hypothetical protein
MGVLEAVVLPIWEGEGEVQPALVVLGLMAVRHTVVLATVVLVVVVELVVQRLRLEIRVL